MRKSPILAALLVTLGVVLLVPGAASAGVLFQSNQPITINDNTTADPTPSIINVTSLRGPIAEMSLTLKKLSHTKPTDLDIRLVGPNSQDAIMMSDACAFDPVVRTDFVFTDLATRSMPNDTCDGNVYKPTNHGQEGDRFGPGPHAATFFPFTGANPNGAWRLEVEDDAVGGTGGIEGWALSITTGPVDSLVPNTGTEGVASVYPSTTAVSGRTGIVTDVDVQLDGVNHDRPDDLDILLVGPQGQKVVLLSDACGTRAARSTRFRWDDEEASKASDEPANDECAYGFSTSQPTDYEPGDTWPAPAPAGPYATSLSAFDFTDPNGGWKLFVNDDAPGGGAEGYVIKHFALDVKTRAKAAVAFTEDAVEIAEGTTRDLTLQRTAESALGPASVVVASQPATAAPGTDFTPVATTVQFGAGEAEKTVPISALADGVAPEPGETFSVTLANPSGDAALGDPAAVTATIPAQAAPAVQPGPGLGGGPSKVPPRPPVPLCAGKRATIVGTAKRDVLRGTKRADVIVALGGDDVVKAAAGNDIVCGGDGADKLSGDAGNDRLFGGAGADRITGGAGADRLLGEAGADRLAGSPGRDTCDGGAGRDRATCEKKRSI